MFRVSTPEEMKQYHERARIGREYNQAQQALYNAKNAQAQQALHNVRNAMPVARNAGFAEQVAAAPRERQRKNPHSQHGSKAQAEELQQALARRAATGRFATVIPLAPPEGPPQIPQAPNVARPNVPSMAAAPNLPDHPLFSLDPERTYPAYLQDLMSAARSQYNMPYHGYQGQRHAPVNREETMARQLAGKTNEIQPWINRAQEINDLGVLGFPDMQQNYMNPYQEQVANRIAELGNRNFREHLEPALQAKFVRLGQSGGKGHREGLTKAARDTANEIAAQQGQLMHQGYGQAANIFSDDQMRRLKSAEQTGELGKLLEASRFGNIAALQNAGAEARARKEAPMRSAEQEHINQLRHNIERFNLYKSIMSGQATQPIATPAEPKSAPTSFHKHNWQHLAGRGLMQGLFGGS